MEREVQHKVNGEMKTEIQYYHRIVVVVLVSTSFPSLGCPLSEKRRSRGGLCLALLQIWSAVGSPLPGCVGGDALYLQAPFVKEVERLV